MTTRLSPRARMHTPPLSGHSGSPLYIRPGTSSSEQHLQYDQDSSTYQQGFHPGWSPEEMFPEDLKRHGMDPDESIEQYGDGQF
eukprot:5454088-Amphidinium_carterae.1